MQTQPRNQSFSEFYESWMIQLEGHLQLLLKVAKENSDHAAAINILTAHHKEFYQVKWANEDVLGFFSPTWVSSLEKAYMWMTGWKPSTIFRLIDSLKMDPCSSLSCLTEEQNRKIAALMLNIKGEEDKVEMEMERLQVRMADRNIMELAQLEASVKRSNDASDLTRVNGFVKVAIGDVLGTLKKVMKMGDCVRLKSLKGTLDVLNATQSVHFLIVTCMFLINMRKWGIVVRE